MVFPENPPYPPSPFVRGQGEGQIELVRTVTPDRSPYADLKTAISARPKEFLPAASALKETSVKTFVRTEP
jgi:hypothetical protein